MSDRAIVCVKYLMRLLLIFFSSKADFCCSAAVVFQVLLARGNATANEILENK